MSQVRPWNTVTVELNGEPKAWISEGRPRRSMAVLKARSGDYLVRLVGDDSTVLWEQSVLVAPRSVTAISFVPPAQGLWLIRRLDFDIEVRGIRVQLP